MPVPIYNAARILMIILTLMSPAIAFLRSIKNISLGGGDIPFAATVVGDIFATPTSSGEGFTAVRFLSFNDDARSFVDMHYDSPNPDYLVPLIGMDPSGLCVSSAAINAPNFPCAMLGFYRNSTTRMWLAINNLTTGTAINVPIDTQSLPFRCSVVLPCTVRTINPTEGEIGGCDMGGDSNLVQPNTLLVVTWNRMRYFWKPLLYFSGIDVGLRGVPDSWTEAGLPYDAGLQFGFAPTAANPYTRMCVMCLIDINGTVEVYSVGMNDAASRTGLRRIAVVSPDPNDDEDEEDDDGTALCIPSVQFLVPPAIIASSILSVTCANGMGWFWDIRPDISGMAEVASVPTATLVGGFSMSPPPAAAQDRPLVVDISIIQVGPNPCGAGLLTAIALLGSGYMSAVPRLPAPGAGTEILSLAVFRSEVSPDISSNTYWLTPTLLYANVPQGELDLGEGEKQHLRNGLGWVFPSTVPAEAIHANRSHCDSINVETLLWLGASTLYSAVTSDYSVLITSTTGSLATSKQPLLNWETISGGCSYTGPTRLGNTSEFYIRLPSSPVLPSTPFSSAILQVNVGINPTIHTLKSCSGAAMDVSIQFISQPSVGDDLDWYWSYTDPLEAFVPAPVSVSYDLPVSNFLTAAYPKLQWMHATPLFFATYQHTGDVTFMIGARAMDFNATIGTSYPGDKSDFASQIYSPSTPYLIVCSMNVVTCYDTSIGNPRWVYTFNSSEICTSGYCSCTANSTLFTDDQTRNYVAVTFDDQGLGTQGIVVMDFDLGTLITSYASGYSKADAIVNECGSQNKFGQFVDLTQVQYYRIGFALPVVGTSCILLLSSPSAEAYVWSIFVVTGAGLTALASGGELVNGILLLSTQPRLEGCSYAGSILGFNVSLLQSLQSTSAAVSGTSPLYTIEGTSFLVASDLLITLAYSQCNTSDQGDTLVLSCWLASEGSFLWFQTINVTDDLIQHLETLTLFPIVQTKASSSLVHWACVAAGSIYCASFAIASTAKEIQLSRSCYGPPVVTVERNMIWATEGQEPFCASFDTGKLLWSGIAPARPAFSFPYNQTSCTDPIIANNGLLLSCSLLGEQAFKQRLYLVSAQNGTILFGEGPVIKSRDYVSISMNGERLTYLNENLKTANTIVLYTVNSPSVVPINATLCAAGSPAYALLINSEGIVATMTPTSAGEEVVLSNFTFDVQTYSLSAFQGVVILDTLVYLPGYQDMLEALYPSLPPYIIPDLRANGIYLTTAFPSSLAYADGEQLYLSAQECNDCFQSCPTYCTLNIQTGVQYQYTGRMLSIEVLIKELGSLSFTVSGNSTSIPYSGDVNLNLARYVAKLPDIQQPISCLNDFNSATVEAQSGRYCVQSGQGLSVVEIVDNSSSYFTFYRTNQSTQPTSSARAMYHASAAWNTLTVLSVEGQLNLPYFLARNLEVLPSTTAAGNIGPITFSNVISDGVLSIGGIGFEIIYTAETCYNATTVLASLPMCPSTLLRLGKGMVDESLMTIAWSSLGESNWGAGFVAAGYRALLPRVLREMKRESAGSGKRCSMLSSECEVVCQATADCNSQWHSAVTRYLSMVSWLPSGSTLELGGGPCTGEGLLDLDVKFYGTVGGEALITTDFNGEEVIIFSSADFQPEVFGVAFTFSRCVFFTLKNVVAQPFGWLAICAVKSLLVTFGFYLAEHWVRGRERQRNASRDRLARLQAENDATMGDNEADAGSPNAERPFLKEPEPINRNSHSCQQHNGKVGTDTVPIVSRFEASSRSIIDRAVSLVAHLSSYRHPLERAGQEHVIRDNMLPKHLDEASLTELLLFVLKEDRRNEHWVRLFASYYEMNMCRNATWVVRQQPLDLNGSLRLSSIMSESLTATHKSLRDTYICYKACYVGGPEGPNLLSDTSPLLGRAGKSLSELPPPALTEVGTLELQRLVGAFNALHDIEPGCFEYAVLGTRHMEERLRPSTLLLVLSLLQTVVTIVLYIVDVYIRSQSSPLTALQMYECVCFMIFNSSLPSTLLVGAVLHSDLSPSMQATDLRGWLKHILRNPFVLVTLLLLSPPLVTHVIPGLLLYCWVLIPPFALAVLLEIALRRTARGPSRLLLAARVLSRIAILLTASIAFSVAFNVADGFMWSRLQGDELYITGSYVQQGYLSALEQDYNDRSMACVWEHLFDTISNFLQMGFLLV